MWQTFFRVCNFLCGFIPNPARRAHIRKTKLYDWAKKYAALRHACPEMRFRHVKMIKGGWNIGFIVDGKYVFKIRKFFDDESHPVKKIMREKRITDAFEHISPLNTFSTRTLRKYEKQWCKQIAHFIYTVHNARPDGIDDLRDRDGDGWNQNDICNNLIVNPKTMKIIGLIDWEYAGWGTLETEFENCVHFSQKLRGSTFKQTIRAEYEKLATKKKH